MRIISVVTFLLLVKFSFSQNPDVPIRTFPWQVAVAYNQMINPQSGISPESGFGCSFLRIFRNDKFFQPIVGLAYHKNHYFLSSYQPARNTSYRDIRFGLSSFSVPLLLRINVGKKVEFFAEAGPSLDLTFLRGKGREITYQPFSPALENAVNKGFGAAPVIMINLGGGVSIPWKSSRCILAAAYRNDAKQLLHLNTYPNPENYRNYLTISAGVNIRLKRLPK